MGSLGESSILLTRTLRLSRNGAALTYILSMVPHEFTRGVVIDVAAVTFR